MQASLAVKRCMGRWTKLCEGRESNSCWSSSSSGRPDHPYDSASSSCQTVQILCCKLVEEKGEVAIQPETQNDELDNMPPESRVGAEMSDRTTKKVIVGILIMLICVPLLQPDDIQYEDYFRMSITLDRWISHENVLSTYPGDTAKQSRSVASWDFAETELLQNTDCVFLKYKKADNMTKEIFPEGRTHPSALRSAELDTILASNDEYGLYAVFNSSARAFLSNLEVVTQQITKTNNTCGFLHDSPT
jgi:hypothetical protein